MAIQFIDTGAAANDGQGDPLRTAFTKCNSNFGELNARYRATVPSSSQGAAGDLAGMYASDASYFYYCTADYDGSTDIWYRVSGSTF